MQNLTYDPRQAIPEYETPRLTVIALQPRGVMCDSPQNLEDIDIGEGHDW